jgi:hypothetical protein
MSTCPFPFQQSSGHLSSAEMGDVEKAITYSLGFGASPRVQV